MNRSARMLSESEVCETGARVLTTATCIYPRHLRKSSSVLPKNAQHAVPLTTNASFKVLPNIEWCESFAYLSFQEGCFQISEKNFILNRVPL